MSDTAKRCEGFNNGGYWFNPTSPAIDPSNPGFVAGKGMWMPDPKPCLYMPNPVTGLCPRHELLKAEGKSIDGWEPA